MELILNRKLDIGCFLAGVDKFNDENNYFNDRTIKSLLDFYQCRCKWCIKHIEKK